VRAFDDVNEGEVGVLGTPNAFVGADEELLPSGLETLLANTDPLLPLLNAEKPPEAVKGDLDVVVLAASLFSVSVGPEAKMDGAEGVDGVTKDPNPPPLDENALKPLGFDGSAAVVVGAGVVACVLGMVEPNAEPSLAPEAKAPKPDPLLAKAPNPLGALFPTAGFGTACPNPDEPNAGVLAAAPKPELPNVGPLLPMGVEDAPNPKLAFGLGTPNPPAPKD
jgi:hypothetical protein